MINTLAVSKCTSRSFSLATTVEATSPLTSAPCINMEDNLHINGSYVRKLVHLV